MTSTPTARTMRHRLPAAAVSAMLLFATLALIPGAPLGADRAEATNTLVPGTSFEIDGNLTSEGGGDWLTPHGAGTTPPPASLPTTGLYYVNENTDVCDSDSDDIGEAKPQVKLEDGPIWRTSIGAVNPASKDVKSIWLGAEKVSTTGTTQDILYIAYELCGSPNTDFALTLYLDGGDGILPFNPADTPTGSTDDILIVFDFDPADITAEMFRFDGTEWGSGAVLSPDAFDAAVSSDEVIGEVAINLAAAGIMPTGSCATITAGEQAASIAGASLTSAVKDVVGVAPIAISSCSALAVTKITEPNITSPALFDYTISRDGGGSVYDPTTLDVSGVHRTTEPASPTTTAKASIAAGETDVWVNLISHPDYAINEDAPLPSGWAIGGLTCTYTDIFAPGSPIETVTIHDGTDYTGETFPLPPVTFNNAPVPLPECTITNTTSAVVVTKSGVGDPGQSFQFDISASDGSAAGFELQPGGSYGPTAFAPSTVVEIVEHAVTADPTWTHTSTVCTYAGDAGPVEVWNSSNPDQGLSPEFATVAGETITCVFANAQDGKIVVAKQTDPDGSAESFDFTTSFGPPFSLSDDQSAESASLSPGTYSVAESTPPTGWTLASATCSDGSDPSAITLDPGETVT
ncbi:MAG: hypothetical protein ABFR89_13105, partial [Actinomycetota bacterium]